MPTVTRRKRDANAQLRNFGKAGCAERRTSGLGLGVGCNSSLYTTLLDNGSAIAQSVITSFGQLGLEASSTYQADLSPSSLVSFGLELIGGACSTFGEQDIATSVVTLLLSIAIAAGTFDDMYVGDYWTINGVNWRVGGFDYLYRTGDVNLTKHHAVIVPDTSLGTGQMNATNTTEGGYAGSLMRTSGLDAAKATIEAAFPGHVLSHREYLTNAVLNSRPSGGAWFDSTVELMNENMVYGSGILRPVSDGVNVPNNSTTCRTLLPLFAFKPDLIYNVRATHWLRDVVSDASFAFVGGGGNAGTINASIVFPIRPYFLIG